MAVVELQSVADYIQVRPVLAGLPGGLRNLAVHHSWLGLERRWLVPLPELGSGWRSAWRLSLVLAPRHRLLVGQESETEFPVRRSNQGRVRWSVALSVLLKQQAPCSASAAEMEHRASIAEAMFRQLLGRLRATPSSWQAGRLVEARSRRPPARLETHPRKVVRWVKVMC